MLVPKFSVIIPIYGVEPYLRECLESIKKQSYKDFEVVLVDDGSTDNCPSICDEYAFKDNRFKVIHKNNEGRVRARQVGIDFSHGEFIVCVDGDDWISPDFLLNFSAIIDKYNPDVLVCDSIYAYPNKNIICPNILRNGFYSKEDLNKEIYPSLIYPNFNKIAFPAQLWAKAFRKSIYIQHQLVDVVVEMGEDRACVIPTLYNSKSMYVADFCGYFYRQVPTSITKAKRPLKIDGPRVIYEHLVNHLDLDKFDFANQLYQGTCHSLFNVCKSQFYSSDGYWKTRKKIKTILSDHVYQECINEAKFYGFPSRKLMYLSLKYRLYLLMYLYARIS